MRDVVYFIIVLSIWLNNFLLGLQLQFTAWCVDWPYNAQVRPLVAYRLILCQLFAQDLTYFCLGADSIILVYSINTLLVTVLKHIRAI